MTLVMEGAEVFMVFIWYCSMETLTIEKLQMNTIYPISQI